MKYTISFPENSTRVDTEEIPWRIAEAITPKDLADISKITAILKRDIDSKTYYEEGLKYESCPLETLTESDWKYLDMLCGLSDLPPLMQGGKLTDINLLDWPDYEEAFKEYPLKWTLIPCSNTTLKLVAYEHMDNLMNAIINKEVVIHDNLTLLPLKEPTQFTAFKNTYMSISTLVDYLDKFDDLDVVVVNKATQKSKLLINKVIIKERCNAIMSWLKSNVENPKNIHYVNGKPTIKCQCRVAMLEDAQLFKDIEVFDAAWNKLLKNNSIKMIADVTV